MGLYFIAVYWKPLKNDHLDDLTPNGEVEEKGHQWTPRYLPSLSTFKPSQLWHSSWDQDLNSHPAGHSLCFQCSPGSSAGLDLCPFTNSPIPAPLALQQLICAPKDEIMSVNTTEARLKHRISCIASFWTFPVLFIFLFIFSCLKKM